MAVGALFFAVNLLLYNWWSSPLLGYRLLLGPGNLTLVYVWHPLFSEEINFWPKLLLLLLGQFSLVAATTAGVKAT